MYRITFRYRDELSRGAWREQSCVMRSVDECREFYGLGVDCEYEIVSVEPADGARGRGASDRKNV